MTLGEFRVLTQESPDNAIVLVCVQTPEGNDQWNAAEVCVGKLCGESYVWIS